MSKSHEPSVVDGDDSNSINDYVQELSDKVSAGGGCAEMWEATQEYRDVNRRGFIGGLLGSLFLGINAANTVSAEDANLPDEPETEVKELNEREAQEVLRSAKKNKDFELLLSELSSQKLRADFDSVRAYQSSYQSDEWRHVRVPFKGYSERSKKREGGVVWTEYSNWEPYGYIFEKEVKRRASLSADVVKALNQSGIDYSPDDTVPVELTHTKFSTDSNGISTDSNTRTVPVTKNNNFDTANSERSVGTSSVGDCLCTATASCIPCGTPKPGCIYDLANAYAGEIAACGTCAYARVWQACVGCVGVLLDNDEWIFCCWCDLGGPWV